MNTPNFLQTQMAYFISPNGEEIKIPSGTEHWTWVAEHTKIKDLNELFKKGYIAFRADSFRCHDLPTAETRIMLFVKKHFKQLPDECLVQEQLDILYKNM